MARDVLHRAAFEGWTTSALFRALQLQCDRTAHRDPHIAYKRRCQNKRSHVRRVQETSMLEAKSRDGNNTVAGEARADGGLQRRQQQPSKLLMTFVEPVKC